MLNTDKRKKLNDIPFSYNLTKSGKTLISFNNKQVIILNEKDTAKFIIKIKKKSEIEIQLILAKLTGNFKHGNESDIKLKN